MAALPTSQPPPDAEQLRLWTLRSPGELRTLRASLLDALNAGAPLAADDLDEVPANVVLVASELATNAIRHGLPPTEVRLLRSGDQLILDVTDHDLTTAPVLTAARPSDGGGRGMQIAQTVSLDLGWYIAGGVKHIWATFPAAVDAGARARADLYRDGITACPDAFSADWADTMHEDIRTAFDEALARPGGAVGRGPHRYYVEIHPEQLRGFVDLVTHPWVVTVCEAVLGPRYTVVELGFDVPLPGAMRQPWHRDFPLPTVTRRERRLDSLAFNLTGVDTVEAMGPFEIALGTQFDDEPDFEHGMFPADRHHGRYQERAVRKYPKRGDISARSALTIHRGTANVSDTARPVLVLGVDAPDAGNSERHDLAVTRGYWQALPQAVRDHLRCPVVEHLIPIHQKHTIEGLVMGEATPSPGGSDQN